jgi:orotidine-5'-phosphate decarboxylase
VGLDPDKDKVPSSFQSSDNWIFEFNKSIIGQVAEHCVAFKPNTAFYESYGTDGWRQFEETVAYIRAEYPNHFVIADAKRGDIGNTSARYAKAFFENMDCQAITVAPYMGEDSVSPFLGFDGKWVIVLGLTSNPGSADFQHHGEHDLHLSVIEKSLSWGGSNQVMIVAGATRGEQLAQVRKAAKDAFLLVPGVGAQGGSLKDVVDHAMLSEDIGLLVNSSRGIIYSDSPKASAQRLAEEMAAFII